MLTKAVVSILFLVSWMISADESPIHESRNLDSPLASVTMVGAEPTQSDSGTITSEDLMICGGGSSCAIGVSVDVSSGNYPTDYTVIVKDNGGNEIFRKCYDADEDVNETNNLEETGEEGDTFEIEVSFGLATGGSGSNDATITAEVWVQ